MMATNGYDAAVPPFSIVFMLHMHLPSLSCQQEYFIIPFPKLSTMQAASTCKLSKEGCATVFVPERIKNQVLFAMILHFGANIDFFLQKYVENDSIHLILGAIFV